MVVDGLSVEEDHWDLEVSESLPPSTEELVEGDEEETSEVVVHVSVSDVDTSRVLSPEWVAEDRSDVELSESPPPSTEELVEGVEVHVSVSYVDTS